MTLPLRHLPQIVGLALLLVSLSISAWSEARPWQEEASQSSPSSLYLATATTSTTQDPWATPPPPPTTTTISAGTITTTTTTLVPTASTSSSTSSTTSNSTTTSMLASTTSTTLVPITTSTTLDPFAPPPPPPSTTSTGGAITTSTTTTTLVPTSSTSSPTSSTTSTTTSMLASTTTTTLAPTTTSTSSSTSTTTTTLAPTTTSTTTLVPTTTTTTTNPTQGSLSLSLDKGWNLLSSTIPFPVSAETIGQEVISVWAWQEQEAGDEGKGWAVYLTGGDTATYAAAKGFLVLKDIQAGEGFWLNSQAENATMVINGSLVTSALPSSQGWNLLGLVEPSSSPLIGIEPVISVWAWRVNDKGAKTWAVYLPEGKGPAYAESKGFLSLDLATLSVGEGFWLNR